MIEVREPTENERLVWAIPIGNIPTNFLQWLLVKKGTRLAMELFVEQEGFIGFYPNKPYGTLCIFDTENNAKSARNVFKYFGGKAGNIITVYISRGEMK